MHVHFMECHKEIGILTKERQFRRGTVKKDPETISHWWHWDCFTGEMEDWTKPDELLQKDLKGLTQRAEEYFALLGSRGQIKASWPEANFSSVEGKKYIYVANGAFQQLNVRNPEVRRVPLEETGTGWQNGSNVGKRIHELHLFFWF